MEPTARGLYDPSFEHDACGVGLVCNLDGESSSKIVSDALEVLEKMDHRGACGCDPESGDGGGIMTALPKKFFSNKVISETGVIPKSDAIAVGMLFLPVDKARLKLAQGIISKCIADEDFRLLEWRVVPIKKDVLGPIALKSLPSIWQVIIDSPNAELREGDLFELRRRIEQLIKTQSELSNSVYISSLSSETIVYKGMLKVDQIRKFYPDLSDPDFESPFALVHSRFSTNTFPSWEKAQPFRKLCHNGEINTLRGNVNRMRSREVLQQAESNHAKGSVLTEGGSDSMILDNAADWLVNSGRSLPHAMMMLVPEAWEGNSLMDPAKRAFYEYHACLMEPWDGPAALPFANGRHVGAILDRNGLRPCRFLVTHDNLVVLSSEVGVLDIDPARIKKKGRVEPGKMFLIDLEENRIVEDEEIKMSFAQAHPYGSWLESLVSLKDIEGQAIVETLSKDDRAILRRNFGYTLEDLKMIISPMGEKGKEALGSMGNDTPLAVLSDQCRSLFDYFKQLFAQVTNPPLDAIREELVTSMFSFVGRDSKIAEDGPHHCQKLKLERPILSNEDISKIRTVNVDGIKARTISLLFETNLDENSVNALEKAIKEIFRSAEQAIDNGATFLILSDKGVDRDHAAVPSLLAVAALHHYLIQNGKRGECGLLVETGEAREVHHFCCLLGYGASAVNPYLSLESLQDVSLSISKKKKLENYLKASTNGVRKVMSKMGISTLESYRGAQIFEAVGLSSEFVDRFFPGTTSRIGGISLGILLEELKINHAAAFAEDLSGKLPLLNEGGVYQWRRTGEDHHYSPLVIASLQNATSSGRYENYQQYADLVNNSQRNSKTLRGLLEFSSDRPAVPIEEVEPWTDIVKRFKTGAMSYGSISSEAHRTLAIAMNKLGGKSNTGEGGEEKDRHDRSHEARSRIKQVASGRFGVTLSYLASADEIQIKMAQGAKPGEGGQLPGEKVFPWIAKTRHSTPFVGLISPPPHHDIYSIEDLAQLIFDLKNTNPTARVTVKLVSEAGIGTVAAGVAKGKADVVLVSGYDGGTGASPKTSIMHAGLPWELGLAETNQTLVLNGLRSRIKIECDGQLKTGKDVVVAALLGADEYGFATAPLVSMGCVMMRKCHLNTCPVGIATQDEELRKKFRGKPENVINYFHFVAEEMREIMAELGFRSIEEMVGRVDVLKQKENISHRKASTVDLSSLLFNPKASDDIVFFDQDTKLDPLPGSMDEKLIRAYGDRESIDINICNEDRTLGTMLSSFASGQNRSKEFLIKAKGSGGQSTGAFLGRGITLEIEGETNDYLGKGLSGGTIVLKVPSRVNFTASENIIAGNVAFYGATSGKAFLEGKAGERFCVRNSGALVVVEGVGDHACEYMTGGRVAILGSTGRNFGAGMSGGYAFVYDGSRSFEKRCNLEMVRLDRGSEFHDELKVMIEEHLQCTSSERAKYLLDSWLTERTKFVRVIPVEYERVLTKARAKVKSARIDAPLSSRRATSA